MLVAISCPHVYTPTIMLTCEFLHKAICAHTVVPIDCPAVFWVAFSTTLNSFQLNLVHHSLLVSQEIFSVPLLVSCTQLSLWPSIFNSYMENGYLSLGIFKIYMTASSEMMKRTRWITDNQCSKLSWSPLCLQVCASTLRWLTLSTVEQPKRPQ